MKHRTYTQIEDSRDRRLWMTQVFIPLATLIVILYTNESTRAEIKAMAHCMKSKANKTIESIKAKKEELNANN